MRAGMVDKHATYFIAVYFTELSKITQNERAPSVRHVGDISSSRQTDDFEYQVLSGLLVEYTGSGDGSLDE